MGDGELRYSRIEIRKQALKFSVAHFTIFSATERENLHGHNFQVECELTAPVGADGLMFDYGIIKKAVRDTCEELEERVILPGSSPYLKIEQDGEYTVAVFNHERLPFLGRDVMILPIANTTVEELSNYLLGILLMHPGFEGRGIVEIVVKVSSSPGQSASSRWEAP